MSLDSIRRTNSEKPVRLVRRGGIIYACEIGASSAVDWKSCEWDEYWRGAVVHETISELLQKFRESYRRFVVSGFGGPDAISYCTDYFSLLEAALELEKRGLKCPRLLAAVSGFGSIGIRNGKGVTTACAIDTATHPAYLPSRIRNASQPHDPKFLPLVTAFDPFRTDISPALYYYYRQIPLKSTGDKKLFVYPAVDKTVRFESFREIHRLTELLCNKNDTLVRQRAEFLAEKVVGPTLKHPADASPIRIADLGGGSGDLCRGMIEHLGRKMPEILPKMSVDWTLVEIAGLNRKRLQRTVTRQREVRNFRYVRSGYLQWIENRPKSDTKDFHVVLMCRQLNNLSDFRIEIADDSLSAKKLMGTKFDPKIWYHRRYLPRTALKSPGAGNIIVAKTRVDHTDGFTFRQPSLTDYFQALYRLTVGPPPPDTTDRAIFYFVRKFCSDSLTLPDGSDALEKLARQAHCVVVEDVDLDPRMLKRHLKKRNIDSLEFETFRSGEALGRSVVLKIREKR
ncbi:MAG TPA: hypothetical protein DEB39_06235 [Planctomycetaceae bacterium]|nr:hypothetical protein [Planctomycetaceae bacterium]